MSKIIIVGAGVAGLSAGIYARMHGYDVSVYERHYKAGGNLTGWDREGYHIDNCIHWLTGTNPNTKLYKMWEELGVLGDIGIHQGESLFTFKREDKSVSLYSDLDRTQQEMLEIAIEDEKEIKSFMKAVRLVQGIEGIGGINNDEKLSLYKKIIKFPILLKYYNLSTGELAERFSNQLLKDFIYSIMGEHFSSLALIIVFATFSGKDGGIPYGSSCEMAKNLEKKFLSLGGELHLSCGVSKINYEGNKATSVTLDNGNVVDGDYIVVSGDPSVIFSKLLDKSHMNSSLVKLYNNPKMLRFSSYHCAFACDSDKVPFTGDVIVEIDDEYKEELMSKYLIIREFSHELSFAPENKNILQTMIYCYEDDCKKFIELSKDRVKYQQMKNKLAEIIKDVIEGEFKELKNKLKVIDVWTPSTYKRYTDSDIGSFMSFALPPSVIPKAISNVVKGLDNVILASQWLQIPGGLPIAAKVGKRAIETIIKKDSSKL